MKFKKKSEVGWKVKQGGIRQPEGGRAGCVRERVPDKRTYLQDTCEIWQPGLKEGQLVRDLVFWLPGQRPLVVEGEGCMPRGEGPVLPPESHTPQLEGHREVCRQGSVGLPPISLHEAAEQQFPVQWWCRTASSGLLTTHSPLQSLSWFEPRISLLGWS